MKLTSDSTDSILENSRISDQALFGEGHGNDLIARDITRFLQSRAAMSDTLFN